MTNHSAQGASSSYVGIGMFIVCCPVLGAHRLGGPDRGALLITAMAAASLTANAIGARRRWRRPPDVRILVSTLALGAGLAAARWPRAGSSWPRWRSAGPERARN